LPTGLDIVGFGPIGRELAKRLASQTELSQFWVSSISDSSATVFPRKRAEVLKAVEWKGAGRKLSKLVFGKNPSRRSSIFVDLTNSDYTKAKQARERALSSLHDGKNFVSANKVALANYFSEILASAKKKKLEVGFGATVCGARHAISVAKNVEEGEIESAAAVLNASTTMILSMLEEDALLSFDDACKRAGETGVLESDWSIDLDGIDAAAKTAILANVLFPKSKSSLNTINRRGIRDEGALELIKSNRSAAEKRIRLVSKITSTKSSLEPTTLPNDSPLAVKGRFNAVQFSTKSLGEISVRSLGGGIALTASVIVSDLMRIAKHSLR
jgi:homoserine dehydrogenase